MNQCKKMGLYLHIPFCIKKCDYCDFLSSTADSKTMECYTKALIREIELSREKMRQYLVDTVFIGGGTPSVLKGKVIEEIMTALRENAPISKNAEINRNILDMDDNIRTQLEVYDWVSLFKNAS